MQSIQHSLDRNTRTSNTDVQSVLVCNGSSVENLEGNYLTYLILSAASGQIGNVELAYDWWLASENVWFANTIFLIESVGWPWQHLG